MRVASRDIYHQAGWECNRVEILGLLTFMFHGYYESMGAIGAAMFLLFQIGILVLQMIYDNVLNLEVVLNN